MAMKFFNPEKRPERRLKRYSECPSTMALCTYSTKRDHSEIHLVDDDGMKDVFFIPQQEILYEYCEEENARYTLVKVSRTPEGEPTFWLMSCVSSRLGYLFSIDAFDDEGEYQPLATV